jgi:hypothetical protein
LNDDDDHDKLDKELEIWEVEQDHDESTAKKELYLARKACY